MWGGFWVFLGECFSRPAFQRLTTRRFNGRVVWVEL
jgi:hypothetical protein